MIEQNTPAPAVDSTTAEQTPDIGRLPDLPDWTPQPIQELWQLIGEHALLGALGIVIVSWAAAKLSQLVIRRGLSRLTQKTQTKFDDHLIERLQGPIFSSVFFYGLSLAIRSLALPAQFTTTTVRLLFTLVVLIWLSAGFPIIRLTLDALGRNRHRFRMVEERTIPLFHISAQLLLVGVASYTVLMVWKIDPTAWLASAGVLGLAVGFAAKDTLANLFAGFFIVADAPYQIGDFVVLGTGERGKITDVGIRSTRMLTRDDIEITMPNALMANAKIMNESGGRWEKERIRIKVGAAYGSDVDHVSEVLLATARNHEHICAEPGPRVRMRGFGDSALVFELLCWIDEPVLRGRLSHELYMSVYKSFATENIEIPFQKSDVYIKEMPSR